MTARSLKQMTALAFAAAVAILTSAAPAKASVSVTYTTSGVFSGTGHSVDGKSVTRGGVTIAFTDVSPSLTTTVPPALNALFGIMTVSGSGTGSFSNVFQLTITQSLPTPGGSVHFTDTVTGMVSYTSGTSTVTLSFNDPSLTKDINFTNAYGTGHVSYTVRPAYDLFPGETTRVTGSINAVVPTPEPGALALAFTGLPLLGLAAWRRRRIHAV